MYTCSTRCVIATVAVALLAAGSAPAVHQDSWPFTPEVEEFVKIYLKTGGDKLTNWVQRDTTSSPDEARRAFRTVDGFTMDLVASEPVIRQPIDPSAES